MKKLLLLMLVSLAISPVFAQRGNRSGATETANNEIVSGNASQNKVYNDLLSRQSMLSEQIGVLSASLNGARGGTARKISAQLELVTADIAVVERLLATFPQSQTGGSIEAVDDQFQQEMDSLAAVRIAATDPFAGRISADPELERMYRDYLAKNGTLPFLSDGAVAAQPYTADNRVFRVMIAISKTPLAPSTFSGLSNVMEQQMPSGGMAYYQGAYSSVNDAQRACRSILAARRFRDAFVVAMVGNRRVPLNN